MADTPEPIVLADRGFFWVGIERREVDAGLTVFGQMYVQYEVPVTVRHPYPVVLVHGGGGQGTDYLGTPDGRPGWATIFLQAGYRVYVVDRPGHGRAPHHPDVLGSAGRAPVYAFVQNIFIPAVSQTNPWRHLHTQWPGNMSGQIGDNALDQFMAGTGSPIADVAVAHAVWQSRGVELLERIGPSILITHSAGGPFGWVVADARPDLVKGIVACEPAPAWGLVGPDGTPSLAWGLAASPLAYDPPLTDFELLETRRMPPLGEGELPYLLQTEPARQLPSLRDIPIAMVTSEAGSARQRDGGTVAYLRQVGATVDHLKLWEMGVHGNGHLLMGEKNNREVAQVLINWLEQHVER